MDNKSNSLRERCRTVTQDEDDRFVGIEANVDTVMVHFPLGFQLADDDEEIRKDILHLFNILNEFKDEEEGTITKDNDDSDVSVEFPLNSYLEIINYFMENGYYMEREPVYKTRNRGKINWSRTIKKQNPILQENNDGSFSPIYTRFTVKELSPNENNEIRYINKHCVYESFKKLGWLFTSYVPPKPQGILDNERFLPILYNKLSNTFNDSERKLLKAMIDMLEKMDNYNENVHLYFGTKKFEHVWESLILNAFGNRNREDFYPRAQWNLPLGEIKSEKKHALQPDTIMEHEGKIYVIDAKYYRFGETSKHSDLPKSTDVNKQITYAEFVHKNIGWDAEKIYNAFLMPYNKESENNLIKTNEIFVNIGEAIGDWKTNDFKYEHIQGFLVDIKYLMYNYRGNKDSRIIELAESIEKAYKKNKEIYENH